VRRSAGFRKTTEGSGEPDPARWDKLDRMARQLGVFVPEIGLTSETFIRWDVEELFAGGTVVVADPPPSGLSQRGAVGWTTTGIPTLAFTPAPGDPPPSRRRRDLVADFLRRHAVEVVLIEYLDFAERWVDTVVAAGLRVWVRGHGVDLSARLRDRGRREAYARLGHEAAGIIVPSRAAAEAIVCCGVPAAKVHVVRYGVEVPPPVGPRAVDRPFQCVMVGRLVPKKAPLLALAAWGRAEGAGPFLTLDVVGDGVLMPEVRGHVHRHGLHDRVRLHGALDHASTLGIIRAADVLLHHAVTAEDGDMEGLPLVVLEALAAGVPVVATRHAGIPEVVTDGVNGRLVESGDVDGMAAAIGELAGSERLRRRIGDEARRTIVAGFTHAAARRTLQDLLGLRPTPGDEARGGDP
jgi:glycosyltransferase involved in cell wall biosynthesis